MGGVPLGPQGLAVVAGKAGELGPREPQRVLEQASLDLGLGDRNQDPDLLERQPALPNAFRISGNSLRPTAMVSIRLASCGVSPSFQVRYAVGLTTPS